MNTRKEQAKILNAFRMGVIPDVELDQLMIGREAETAELKRMIKMIAEEETSSIRFLNGAYGSGKSFMLEYVKEWALKDNYVVASLSINSGFNMSRFDEFYTNIMSSLAIHNTDGQSGTEFEGIFNGWVKRIKEESYINDASRNIYQVIQELNAYNNAFASVLMIYMRAMINKDGHLANIAASWIKGDRNISYELKKQLKVKGSIDNHNAMEIFKGFVKMLTLIGYKGLIITIDEAELMMQLRSDIRLKAYTNIRFLIDACGVGDVERCGFVLAGTNDLFYDTEKGFPSYDALRQRLGENITDKRRDLGNVRQPIIQLRVLEEKDFYTMGEKLAAVHKAYYDYQVDAPFDNLFNLVMIECKKEHGEDTVTMRYFAKKMIEMLDLLEKEPTLPIFKAKVKIKLTEKVASESS